jgi:methyl-accepting chemotaxis protein
LNHTIEDIKGQADKTESSVLIIAVLARSSEEISGVMEVIRNIAKQTNLLALNAAISEENLARVSSMKALPPSGQWGC